MLTKLEKIKQSVNTLKIKFFDQDGLKLYMQDLRSNFINLISDVSLYRKDHEKIHAKQDKEAKALQKEIQKLEKRVKTLELKSAKTN